MKRLQSQGFTFVELMVAASIFAIVAVAIYSTFGTGVSAWKRSEKAGEIYQDIRLALDKMAQDLENAVLYFEEDVSSNFAGEKNKISFYSLVENFQTFPVHPELKKITYSLDESTHILQRVEHTFPESVQELTGQEHEEIAAKITNLNFSYCYKDEEAEPPYRWNDTWDSAENIPRGVKIELEVDAGEKLTFTKYVFIPTGEKGQEEEELGAD